MQTKVQDIPRFLMDAVHDGVVSTFESFGGPTPVPLGTAAGQPQANVIGIVSLTGLYSFSLSLGLTRDTALTVVRTFFGADVEFDSPDMPDAIGELVNMMAGDVAARLESIGLPSQISLPSILSGEGIDCLHPNYLQSNRMFFEARQGPFWTGVCLQRANSFSTGR